jgi:putative transposase
VSEKFELVAAEKADPTSRYPLIKMCAWLGVSTSGFYDHCNAVETGRARRRAKIIIQVQAAHKAGRGAYGVRRIHAMLRRCDDPEVASCSEKLVRSVMGELGLSGCQPRGYKSTTRPDPEATGQPADLLGRDFTAEQPGTKLVGDITYLRTWQGWLYLATVIDCCTREVIGWSMADHMRTSLVVDAISMAAARGGLKRDAIFHSDRGSRTGLNRWTQHRLVGWSLTVRRVAQRVSSIRVSCVACR